MVAEIRRYQAAIPPPVSRACRPRLAPPLPARSRLAELRQTAESIGLYLMPWQERAGRYLMATDREQHHLYREVCIVASRQNGKTSIAKPLIIRALRGGRRVMHIAQTRELPRHMFGFIADALSKEPELFPRRRGKTIWPRYGAGQEEVVLENGGTYRIAASTTGGARGWSNDLVIIDELLEISSFDAMSAIEPTLTMSDDPQIVEFSNAGTKDSLVLNSVRDRRETDPSLAYLEWSAAPDLPADSMTAWRQANPAMSVFPAVRRTLEAAYRKHQLAGTLDIFEREHLCRWTDSSEPAIVEPAVWQKARAQLDDPRRPAVAVSVDPSGRRVSAVAAWRLGPDSFGLRLLADVTGSPINMDALGPDLRTTITKVGGLTVGYDPWTDAPLVRYFPHNQKVRGQQFADASREFVQKLEAGQLHWDQGDEIGQDLRWTTKRDQPSGAWMAVKVADGPPITAALAAIRATWMASTPATGKAQVW